MTRRASALSSSMIGATTFLSTVTYRAISPLKCCRAATEALALALHPTLKSPGNDVIDTLLNEGDRVQYVEAVDNRSGRMKAHQVTGGTGAPKPPLENKGGKGVKGKKGGKRNAHSDSSLPNPIPSLPGVPSQDGPMAANLSALSDTAAMFGCGKQGILMGKGGFPSACCGGDPAAAGSRWQE